MKDKPIGRLLGGNGDIIDIYLPDGGIRSKEHLEAWLTEELVGNVIYNHYTNVCGGDNHNPEIICRASKDFAMELLSAELIKAAHQRLPEDETGIREAYDDHGNRILRCEVDLRYVVSSVIAFGCGYASGRNDEAEARERYAEQDDDDDDDSEEE